MKKSLPLLFLASTLTAVLFFSCDLNEIAEADIPTIRKNIKLTFEITDTGSTFSWTKPNHLSSHAEYYYISDESLESTTSSIYCYIVDYKYQDGHEVRIKKSYSSVDFTSRLFDHPTYLWTLIDGTYYNLGEFKVTTTTINAIKQDIRLNVDNTDTYNTKFQWAISDGLPINPLRFLITEDSSTNIYSDDHVFDCLVVGTAYKETYYDDNVSIKRNCYTKQGNLKLYEVVAELESSQFYYLWIQTETGTWYNLGQFTVMQ